jgi:hypothetical protein
MTLTSIKTIGVNAFIGVVVAVVLLDTLPQSPGAVRRAVEPVLYRLAINQGPWSLFAPEPDTTNTRLWAEVTYRDGERREWRGTDWSQASPWEKWIGHRRFEWLDHIGDQKHAHVYEPWCRAIAREARPDFPSADQGAEVRILYQEAPIPDPAQRPWKSFQEPLPFDEGWILTIEKLE